MGHKGYYGQYTGNSKFSKKHDEDYDAKEAYNKNLTASARLHYLENLRHDHDSPAKNKVEGMTHEELAEFSQNRPTPASGKTGYERHMEMHRDSAVKFLRKKRGEAGFEQDPQEARYERQSRRMTRKKERKQKRNAAPQKHCMN